jgi:thiamine biosynthesis lipoprotein
MVQLQTGALTQTSFRALGTEVLLISPAAGSLATALQEAVAEYERRLSRFQPDSEVARLSTRSGAKMTVSTELFALLQHAAAQWRETGGLVDPLVLPELEAAGYDRTFADVERDSSATAPAPRAQRQSFGDVQLDPAARTVLLPAGARLDLGGIAKGWIVDRLAERLTPHGPFIVDAGGDIAARGAGPDGGPGWLIGVANPFAPDDDLCWLRLEDSAVATSTTQRRQWRRGGETLHHLIDPRTGRPADSGLAQVTVIASTALEADVEAKAALILGCDEGYAWLAERGRAALLVAKDGIRRTPGWPSDAPRPLAS